MGRTPPRARRSSTLAATALIALAGLLLPASLASAKKEGGPPGQVKHGNSHGHGNGNGNGNAQGHPSDGGYQQPASGGYQPSSSDRSSGSTRSNGNGHSGGGSNRSSSGGSNGNGNAYGHTKDSKRSSGSGGAKTSTGGSSPSSGSTPSTSTGGTPGPAAADPVERTAGRPAARGNARQGGRTRRSRERGGRSRDGSAPGRRGARARTGTARRTTVPAPGPETVVGATASSEEVGRVRDEGSGGGAARDGRERGPAVVRTFERVIEVIPGAIKVVIATLGILLLAASAAWAFLARTARFLRRQRQMLLGEIGVLQGALLPNVPAELSRLEASVAYRPAEGLAAGGDFYDAFALDDGRVGVVVGDVAGHGKDALMHTALLRYTLRAYLEADLEPRVALQVAGRSLDRGFDTLATVVLAVYDPGRHVLRYASAGHPPPVFLGEADHVPVTQASSPPIGTALPTGLRQTTVSLPAGSAVCFFTDGLIEARREGELIGRLGLVDIIRRLGPKATAAEVLDAVAEAADSVTDDMAACMFRVADGPSVASTPRVEEIEVRRGEPLDATLGRFLAACGLGEDEIAAAIESAGRTVRQFRAAVVRVSLPRGGPRVEVRPANVESFASVEARRAAI
jgi:hypothetical protein